MSPTHITHHVSRPAIVAHESHPNQRYFTEGRTSHGIHGEALYTDVPHVRVYRDATKDHAELLIRLACMFEATAVLTPANLRRLASDLLDAAHDIEQHPAAALAAQAAAVPA